jgi:hypothetical protein
MELNLPWVLIEASQKRWTSEKMSLGQAAGGKHTVKSLAGWWFGTFCFSIYWEESSQLTNSYFQRGRYTTN